MINNEYLLRVADLEHSVPKERFTFYRFVGLTWKGAPNLSCGTTACMTGWAAAKAIIPGLTLCHDKFLKDDNLDRVIRYEQGGRVWYGNAALKECFGLTLAQVQYLFYPDSYGRDDDGRFWRSKLGEESTIEEVAAQIRRFVAAGGIPEEDYDACVA